MAHAKTPRYTANILIDQILSEQPALLPEIAAALMAPEPVIEAYRAGHIVPIERQMLLAAYAIERAPAYARRGYRLRAQLRAAIAFATHETETHLTPPSHEWWT